MQDIKVKPSKGLVCKACGGRKFKVIYTRAAHGGRLMRRRQCCRCGRRFTTWESMSCL
ncbi:MAG TPA: hypothetical protein PLX18_12410 [Anaerohalosphaeraceae bacterium]|nr:hypothetical protein [Anaerohalosphaeraceae bacterium]